MAKKVENKEIKLIENNSLIILLLVVALVLLIINMTNIIKNKDNIQSLIEANPQVEFVKLQKEYPKIVKQFEKVTQEDIIKDFKKDKLTIVYTGYPGCPHCVKFVQTIDRALKNYDFKVKYLDVSQEPVDKLAKQAKELEEHLGSTPFTFAIEDGKVKEVFLGNLPYEQFVKFLEDIGVSKK